MCYYNAVNIVKSKTIQLGGIEKPLPLWDSVQNPVLSGFDYANSPVLKKRQGESDFDIMNMEWGFLPEYIKTRTAADRFRRGYKDDRGIFHPPIITLNAIGEEILYPKKIYRKAALERRCLALSTGFFEWRHHFGVNKKNGQPLKTAGKYPYYIHIKNRAYFFMAGIWQPWQDIETGEYVETFSIITTAANSLMAQVHNVKKRMPVILPDEIAFEWLMKETDEMRILEMSSFQYDAALMEAYSIAKDFRESAIPAAPVAYDELPGIIL